MTETLRLKTDYNCPDGPGGAMKQEGCEHDDLDPNQIISHVFNSMLYVLTVGGEVNIKINVPQVTAMPTPGVGHNGRPTIN